MSYAGTGGELSDGKAMECDKDQPRKRSMSQRKTSMSRKGNCYDNVNVLPFPMPIRSEARTFITLRIKAPRKAAR